MIVVDTSALMAVLLDEPAADKVIAVLERDEQMLISAGTLAEALIVADRRNLGEPMRRLVEGLAMDVCDVTPEIAKDIAAAYARWGKGIHAAGLNFGDCFAYALARQRGCPLLFVGEDFALTDVQSVEHRQDI